jgi:hypothetical protein
MEAVSLRPAAVTKGEKQMQHKSFRFSARRLSQLADAPRRWALPLVAVAIVLATAPTPARSAEAGNWIGTWATSPQPIWDADFFAPLTIPRSM